MKKIYLSLTVALLTFGIWGLTSNAHAAWGEDYCDVTGESSLKAAIDGYNQLDEADRICKVAIRFKQEQTISVAKGVLISGAVPELFPGDKHTAGVRIRKCYSFEEGCPSDLTDTDVVLDASGYTGTPPNGVEGDCPITVYREAKVRFSNFKLIVKNKEKAFCTVEGTPIPLEDSSSEYAWIHNVTIEEVPCVGDGCVPPAPTCDLNATASAGGGFDLSWRTTDAWIVFLEGGELEGGKGSRVSSSGTRHVSPTSTTTYTLAAIGPGGRCQDQAVATPLPPPDQDLDGIVNGNDDCPGTPVGTKVNTRGCPDRDGDGVRDDNGADRCPDEFGSAIHNGCPTVEDEDNDGVVNGNDDCAGTPAGTKVNTRGCPDRDGDGVRDDNGADRCPDDFGLPTRNGCPPEPPVVVDPDPDGDGITTAFEDADRNGVYDIGEETDPNDKDTDNDGTNDGKDCFPLDGAKQDCGEEVIVVDPDYDDDGICDKAEEGTDPITGEECTRNADRRGDNCAAAFNPDQMDGDGDGIGDACDPNTTVSPVEKEDEDRDGVPDEFEDGRQFCTKSDNPDTDGDGLKDGEEVNGVTSQGGFGACDPDVDGDGICDGPSTVCEKDEENNCKKDEDGNDINVCTTNEKGSGDNCPIVKNEDQEDVDDDGIGNKCQNDKDGDGVLDDGVQQDDNCPFIINPDQRDEDGDQIGDLCDTDFDLLAFLRSSGGCGCRIDSPAGKADMLPFLAMVIPLVLFRVVSMRKKAKGKR